MPDAQSCNTHPHNIYMEWLIENGAVGLLLFITFLVTALRKCIRSWPDNRLNPVFIGLFIAFILRIWPIASSTNFFSSWGAPPFWLVLGALLAYTVRKEAPDAGTSVTF
jgi:O-antigen ligase